MKDTLQSLLTLVIMVIGLAVIIGGPGAVRFLFAPFTFLIGRAIQLFFVALTVIILVVAARSGKGSGANGSCASSSSVQHQAALCQDGEAVGIPVQSTQ